MEVDEHQTSNIKKKNGGIDGADTSKKSEKKPLEAEEHKPRIVLTFRSEKTGAKNSNMKIVTTEEKNDEVSPRRSNRSKTVKYESDDENEVLVIPNKDKNVSETDEASDSSHTTPKRSTRHRSRESDSVLANAIARKEKSYETSTLATQRPPRRIKPTAKVLANKELVELQISKLISNEKPSEQGVRTRRSTRVKSVEVEQMGTEKRGNKRTNENAVIDDEDDDDIQIVMEGNPANEKKSKVKISLDETSPNTASLDEDYNDEGDLEGEEYEPTEDDEEDDDTEVISKLIEADGDSIISMEESDEEFLCTTSSSKRKRPTTRRSTRLCSSYGNEDEECASPTEDENNKSNRRRSSRKSKTLDVPFTNECDNTPAGGDEGSEATCPDEESGGIIATCFCESPSNVCAAPSELTEPVFCQAIELVDSIRVGCSHGALKESDGSYAPLIRAGPRAPYLMACKLHHMQLRKHMCCPACGLYCTQGFFYQCSEGHLFHLECGLPYNDTKLRPGCPHCGVYSYRWQPVNRQCFKVKLEMRCSNKRIFLPDQRVQCTPAYLSFCALKPSQVDQTPVIPEDLLPSLPIDIKDLREKLATVSDSHSDDPLNRLCDSIEAGESVEELIPKIVCVPVSDINKSLERVSGGTCLHVASSLGHVAAVHALNCRGATIDACDVNARTPLLLAVFALFERSSLKVNQDESSEEPTKVSMEMEVDDSKAETGNKDVKEEKFGKEVIEQDKVNEEDLIKVIKYLVAAGCDVNLPGPEGMTALHVAAQHGSEEVCKVILSAANVEVDPRDHGGWTPLVWAAENKHSHIVRLLLSNGADATTSDNEGNACVHWCALGGDARALHALLHAAPHAHHRCNAHQDTPLHVAARQGHYACVVVLLARGARTDVKNTAGELPVDVSSGQCKSAIWLNMQMHQPPPCKLLSSDISNGRENHPVPCVNEVDDEPLPDDFTYVTEHVMPRQLAIDNTIDTLQGCSCSGSAQCSSVTCACCALGVRRWSTRGRLAPDFPHHEPPMLFECNQTCACNPRICNNNMVSRALRGGSLVVRAQVFRTRRRGWGLRARGAVSRGAPVAAYCGELLAAHAADTRAPDHYMFALDIKQDLLEQCTEKVQLCVDAAKFGSAARFINHSCSPNLAPVRVFTATRDLRLPTVALFAVRDIRPGEEFTFDYGDKFWSVKKKFMKCECESPDCRYPTKVEDTET